MALDNLLVSLGLVVDDEELFGLEHDVFDDLVFDVLLFYCLEIFVF